MDKLTPARHDLWFLPLGGTGEIGMNMNLYGHDGRWLMVDCGVTFRKGAGDAPPKVLMPDPAFIHARRERLVALVLSHAHEDHIGAIAHLWPQLECPVYATAFTAFVLRRKLKEAGLIGRVHIIEVKAGESVEIAPFRIEWINVTHSIPEAHGLLIATCAGNIFHTGDWKLDPEPVIGAKLRVERFQQLSSLPVDAMVCDSTNALEAGSSASEGEMFDALHEIVKAATGAVVVTIFASNLARLHTLGRLALKTGRSLCLLGRSLRNMQHAAKATGHWRLALDLAPPNTLTRLPKDKILAVATGSQGDTGAALDQLARKAHPNLRLEAGDLVVFSSRIIPGNEEVVCRIIDMLKDSGVDVVTNDTAKIHASGHAAQDELQKMYGWVQPRLAIPVHGTARHLSAHAKLAEGCGATKSLVGLNGDLFRIAPSAGLDKQLVKTGRLGLWPEGLKAC